MILSSVIDKIKDSSLLKDTLKLSSSSVLLIILPLLVTPILSRVYSPEDYGAWGIYSSVMFIVSSFIFLSYENTLVKSNDEEEIPSLILLCLCIAIGIISIVIGGFFLGRLINIPFFLDFPSISWLFATFIFTSLHTIEYNIANRSKKYGFMSITNIINGFSQAIFRILLGVFPIFSYGLIVGNVLAYIIATLFLFIVIIRYTWHLQWNKVSVSSIKALSQKYKKFPLFDAPARLIEFTVGNIVVIILSFYFRKEEIGCFSMVIQFILLPIAVVGSAMGNVYYRELSEKSVDSIETQHTTIKVGKITLLLSILPICFLALGGDQILVMFLGDKWIDAGKMALCLAIYSVPVILSEPLLPAFRVLDRQELRFKFNLINLIFAVASLILSSIIFDNIYISLIFYSVSYAIARFIIYSKILNITNVSIKDISPYFILIMVMCYSLICLRLVISYFVF